MTTATASFCSAGTHGDDRSTYLYPGPGFGMASDSCAARPGLRPRWAARMLEAALGCGAGVALSSIAYFLLLLAHAAVPASVVGLNSLLLGYGVWLTFRARERALQTEQPAPGMSSFRWNWLLALALLAGFVLVLSGLIGLANATPYGEWDAWSIWNLRAKYLADPGGAWQNAVSPLSSVRIRSTRFCCRVSLGWFGGRPEKLRLGFRGPPGSCFSGLQSRCL